MKYFYKDIEIDITESVYCPREDSELLAKVLDEMRLKGKKCLEIGCGSGLLSIVMAKKGASVTAVDINDEAVSATKKNAEKNHINIDAFVSNMFDAVKDRFDIIVFNPPYLPIGEDESDDIIYSGGSSGREVIEMFLSSAVSYMKPSGILLLIISSLTGEHEVISLVREAGLKARIAARHKISWEELIVIHATQS